MSKAPRDILTFIGILLLLNGFLNIIDDAKLLTYDIASILSGIGFVIISYSNKR